MRAYVLFGAAVALASGASVQAASLTDYNYIVTGNMTISSSHTDGTLAVGGNLTSSDWAVFNKSVTVGGAVSGQFNMNSGTLTYGSLTPGYQVNWNGGSTAVAGSFNVSTYADLMAGTSNYYKSLTANSTLVTSGNPTFTATPDASDIAVFSVDGSIFSNSAYQNGWNFSGLSSNVTVVINVSGTNINFTTGNFNNTGFNGNIIWNFYEAETINLSSMGGTFQGTILAPNADLTISSRQINGNVYVENLYASSGAELHLYPYEGYVPSGTPPVPEAATLGLILPAAGLLLRRRKSA